jgi:glutamate synthase domain-containing protein 2
MGQPLRQYFFAGDLEERPYNRVTRSWVYASAKGQNNYVGFGSQVDHDEPGRMHILPAIFPTLTRNAVDLPMPRLIGANRAQPYQPRRFANISGMSFGALSPNAVRALSRGAKLAECYMSTGEGSLSPYHVEAVTSCTRLAPPSSDAAPTMAGSMTRKQPPSWRSRR